MYISWFGEVLQLQLQVRQAKKEGSLEQIEYAFNELADHYWIGMSWAAFVFSSLGLVFIYGFIDANFELEFWTRIVLINALMIVWITVGVVIFTRRELEEKFCDNYVLRKMNRFKAKNLKRL